MYLLETCTSRFLRVGLGPKIKFSRLGTNNFPNKKKIQSLNLKKKTSLDRVYTITDLKTELNSKTYLRMNAHLLVSVYSIH